MPNLFARAKIVHDIVDELQKFTNEIAHGHFPALARIDHLAVEPITHLLVFKPVLLNARFLKEIAPLPGEDEVDFCMVEDPFASLNRGSTMGRTQLALLIHRPLPQSDRQATETWEDEGGTYAKCA